MTNRCMAMNAANCIWIRYIFSEEAVYHIVMALHTVVLKNPAILLFYHNGFMEILRRECLGVMIAIFGLSDILSHKGMRQMAVNTGC